jgi:Mn-containing catalase
MQFSDDPGTLQALQFLMTREITHMKAFTAALDSLGKKPFSIGSIPPTPELVRQYFDDSTGIGDRGEPNVRGPWNQGDDIDLVEAPAFKQFVSEREGTRGNGQGAQSTAKPRIIERQRATSSTSAKRSNKS